MLKNLDASYEKVMYTDAENIEKEINYKRDQLRKEHLSNLENGEYPIQSGMVYNNLFMSIEKVGDHIMNVSSALTGRF
jgi:phosphate:Na+ symporter